MSFEHIIIRLLFIISACYIYCHAHAYGIRACAIYTYKLRRAFCTLVLFIKEVKAAQKDNPASQVHSNSTEQQNHQTQTNFTSTKTVQDTWMPSLENWDGGLKIFYDMYRYITEKACKRLC